LGPRPGGEHEHAELREDLRLRTRWIQELSACAAWELGARLAAAGRIDRPELVRWLTLGELDAVVLGGDLPADLVARAAEPPGPPLPAAFRLAADGTVMALRSRKRRRGQGEGAGGGRGVGPVAHADGRPPPRGAVLVVGTLEPALAALLPGLAGLVAETGNVLSHLAILAREMGVPTVVGVPGATQRFPQGVTVLVDGASGQVQPLEDHDRRGRP
jgi:phosphohistidine swiveling domain-containing protein